MLFPRGCHLVQPFSRDKIGRACPLPWPQTLYCCAWEGIYQKPSCLFFLQCSLSRNIPSVWQVIVLIISPNMLPCMFFSVCSNLQLLSMVSTRMLPTALFWFTLSDSSDFHGFILWTHMQFSRHCMIFKKQYHIYTDPERQTHNNEVLLLFLARFLIEELKASC